MSRAPRPTSAAGPRPVTIRIAMSPVGPPTLWQFASRARFSALMLRCRIDVPVHDEDWALSVVDAGGAHRTEQQVGKSAMTAAADDEQCRAGAEIDEDTSGVALGGECAQSNRPLVPQDIGEGCL